MASSADTHGDGGNGRAGVIDSAAGAGDGRFDVFGMNLGLHGVDGW